MGSFRKLGLLGMVAVVALTAASIGQAQGMLRQEAELGLVFSPNVLLSDFNTKLWYASPVPLVVELDWFQAYAQPMGYSVTVGVFGRGTPYSFNGGLTYRENQFVFTDPYLRLQQHQGLGLHTELEYVVAGVGEAVLTRTSFSASEYTRKILARVYEPAVELDFVGEYWGAAKNTQTLTISAVQSGTGEITKKLGLRIREYLSIEEKVHLVEFGVALQVGIGSSSFEVSSLVSKAGLRWIMTVRSRF